MNYTDKNIPILCSECTHIEEGLDAMIQHIKDEHDIYKEGEIEIYARQWMEDAYERMEQEEINYSEDRKLEQGIRRIL